MMNLLREMRRRRRTVRILREKRGVNDAAFFSKSSTLGFWKSH